MNNTQDFLIVVNDQYVIDLITLFGTWGGL